MIKICIFALAVNLSMHFSSVAQTIPNFPELSPNAKNELIDIVNIVFEKGKQGYGFLDADKIDHIVLGKTFLLHFIPSDLIPNLKSCPNIKDMADKGYMNNTIQSVLYIGSRPVCLVDYYKKAGIYHIGGLTSTKLIEKVNYVITHCQNPIIVTSYLKTDWYFTDITDGYVQIYSLDRVTNTGLNKIAANSNTVFTFLNEIEVRVSSGAGK